MSAAHRNRAAAASVFDALGAGFWGWWRATLGGGLLVLLFGLLLLAAQGPKAWHFGMYMVVVLLACALGAGLSSMALQAAQRHARWQSMQGQRRLPCMGQAARLDAVIYTLLMAWGWCALALVVASTGAHLSEFSWTSALAWCVGLLVLTAASATLASSGNNWPGYLLGASLCLSFLFGSSILDVAASLNPMQLVGIGALAGGVVVLRFQPHGVGSRGPTWGRPLLDALPTGPGVRLRAWLDAHSHRIFWVVLLFSSGAWKLLAAFVPNRSADVGTWVGPWGMGQVMVVGFTAIYWQPPPHLWRSQMTPRFARRRAALALSNWWRECLWLVPLIAACALLNSPWAIGWPEEMRTADILLNAVQGLPWLVANLGLLIALAILWVGVRRGRRIWDLLWLLPLGACMWLIFERKGRPPIRVDWSGRLDVLLGLLLATALVLAVASWVWRRGSLAGIQRWGVAPLKPRTG